MRGEGIPPPPSRPSCQFVPPVLNHAPSTLILPHLLGHKSVLPASHFLSVLYFFPFLGLVYIIELGLFPSKRWRLFPFQPCEPFSTAGFFYVDNLFFLCMHLSLFQGYTKFYIYLLKLAVKDFQGLRNIISKKKINTLQCQSSKLKDKSALKCNRCILTSYRIQSLYYPSYPS